MFAPPPALSPKKNKPALTRVNILCINLFFDEQDQNSFISPNLFMSLTLIDSVVNRSSMYNCMVDLSLQIFRKFLIFLSIYLILHELFHLNSNFYIKYWYLAIRICTCKPCKGSTKYNWEREFHHFSGRGKGWEIFVGIGI